jgi:predicted benzoate:H+ symporter BenE
MLLAVKIRGWLAMTMLLSWIFRVPSVPAWKTTSELALIAPVASLC